MVVGVPDRLQSAISNGAACLFLSSHLDDAVLSCAALMGALSQRGEVTVATAFTAAGPAPHTRAARSFLRQCAAPDADTLFAQRRAEDREVLSRLGVAHVPLGLTDALYRRRDGVPGAQVLGNVVPELVHRYPTYRLDIAKGRVSRGDKALIAQLTAQVDELMTATGAQLLFGPLAVGRHGDHVIARRVCESFAGRVIYYSDFPYDRAHEADDGFIAGHGLTKWSWERGVEAKPDVIRGYRSQADALFPDGEIPAVAETYYLSTS
jgi:LmbE family N-acetylglucosaminyl deacetylase